MSRRILLADDSVTIQKVIELTFSEQDYEILAVSDGTSAITQLTEARPDLVLADVHMPGASGLEVCRLAKELHPGLPVVLMVGTFEPFEEADATAAGADSYLKKPFDSQELLRLVAELMPKDSTGSSSPAEPAAEPAADWGLGEHSGADLDALDLAAPDLPTPELPGSDPLGHDLPPATAVAGEVEEEVDLESWDKLEIATAEEEEEAGEPVWGNFDASFAEAALGEAGVAEDEALVAEAAGATGADEGAGTAFGELEPVEEPVVAGVEEPPYETPGLDMPAIVAGEPATEGPAITPDEPAPAEAAAPADETAAWPVAAVELSAPPAAPAELFDVATARRADAAARETMAPPVALDGLSDEDVDRVARRVIELLGDKVVRDIAWEVIPDVAELVIKDRIRELEAQVDGVAEP